MSFFLISEDLEILSLMCPFSENYLRVLFSKIRVYFMKDDDKGLREIAAPT